MAVFVKSETIATAIQRRLFMRNMEIRIVEEMNLLIDLFLVGV
jgi:hypothetical protein